MGIAQIKLCPLPGRRMSEASEKLFASDGSGPGLIIIRQVIVNGDTEGVTWRPSYGDQFLAGFYEVSPIPDYFDAGQVATGFVVTRSGKGLLYSRVSH